jgi:hypothetical protein
MVLGRKLLPISFSGFSQSNWNHYNLDSIDEYCDWFQDKDDGSGYRLFTVTSSKCKG